jgi:hypothetical protein
MEVQMRDGLPWRAVVLEDRCAAGIERPLYGGRRPTDHLEHWTAIPFGQRVQVLNVMVGHDQCVAWSRGLVSTNEHSETFIFEGPWCAASPAPEFIAEVATRHVDV